VPADRGNHAPFDREASAGERPVAAGLQLRGDLP
jgi:hypothetical protein